MTLSPEEIAKRDRFAETYARAQCPAMVAVERRACGCDYGGNSLTTREEADRVAALLDLQPGSHLLDVGAGAGWPGLYFAERTGCAATLVDLPLSGLQAASERAARDGMADRCRGTVADGAWMPFHDGSFDAISHSDVLCCLKDKCGVLESCRRVIRDRGRMVFTVIWIPPGLSPAAHARALEGAPEFGEVEIDYPALLVQTGWRLLESTDVTADYGETVRRFRAADRDFADDLETLLGAAAFAERQSGLRAELTAIEEGLLRRDLFVAVPCAV